MFIGPLLLSACVLGASAPAQSAPPGDGASSRAREFARELRVREAALDPDAASAWLNRALAAPAGELPWTATVEALDALCRAHDARPELDLEPWRARLLELATHAHPNVRAGAWRALARSSPAALQGVGATNPVATWEERMERARAIAASSVASAEFAALCEDRDQQVARIALAEGMQARARDDERIALAWMRAFEIACTSEDGAGMELLQLLELAPRGERIATRVAELAGARAADQPERWNALHALCLACLGRQTGVLDEAGLDRLCAEWNAASHWQSGSRALLARSARALGAPLGKHLAARACMHADDPEAALECFAGAVEALDSSEVLRIAAAQVLAHPTLAEPLLDSLRRNAESWDPDALVDWLTTDIPPPQRAHTLLIVAETFRQNRDPGSATILVRGLEDPDPTAAAEAFQGLAGAPDPRPWMSALHAAWVRHPSAWREERLADLSRDIAWTPFRSDLLELASQSRTSSARAAELLAPFRGDVEVAEALREWLEQDLARIRQARGREGAPPVDPRIVSSALSLLRALVLVSGDAALPSLAAALEASRGTSLELGKVAIFQLGRSEIGRRGLRVWLDPPAPSRLRAEAALALAPFADREPSIRVLLADYRHYDEDLRMRALRAFAAADDGASANLLLEVARSRASGAAEMLTAVECVGLRARSNPGLIEEMFRWLEEATLSPDLRTLTIAELVKLKQPSVLARLAERFEALESRPASGESSSRANQERAFERDVLITTLASADAIALLADEVPFEYPLERAADEFAARAAGQHRAEVEFTCRPELELIAAFARAGRLEGALDRVGAWRGLDARFLLESAARVSGAARASGEGSASGENAPPPGQRRAPERLALAALIALAGERTVDDSPRIRFEARRLALEAARERGDDPAFAARGAALEHDVRTGALSSSIFARVYGEFDPRHGVDGLARLACDVHLARARAALALGRGDEARREVEEARLACGASSAARAAVLEHEEKLGRGGR